MISYPLIAESNAENNTGTATGLASFVIMGGAGLAQVLFGFLMQGPTLSPTKEYLASNYQHAMWIFPIATGGALLAVLFMRETYCKRVIKK